MKKVCAGDPRSIGSFRFAEILHSAAGIGQCLILLVVDQGNRGGDIEHL